MSALAGIWNFDAEPEAARSCVRILAAQAMYGPHDQSHWDGGNISLGRRLFRALPEDANDTQPLIGGDGRFVLVADVRLDNREELASALSISPDRARGLPDSAILLAAWERWQSRVFDHLVGDYAFVVWDKSQRQLVLARDPLGAKPLHYHRGNTMFAFASMPKGLHSLPKIPRAPDEDRIAEFLALMPESGSQSFFKGVERVEAGCFATVTPNGLTAQRHWEPQRKILKLAGAEAYAEGLRYHLDQAVQAQMRGANGAVAAHLSSGFDSSAVATSAAMQMSKSGGRVTAFTSVPREGYDGPSPRGRHGDEGPTAAKTAALYANMDHVLVRTQGRTPLDGLDRSFFLYDRPTLNLCNMVWSDAILDAAKARQLKVLLTGQMGNMSISYDGLALLPQLVRRGRWLKWLHEGRGAIRKGNMRWLGMLNTSFGPYIPLLLWTRLNKILENRDTSLSAYSALRSERFDELNLAARAKERALDIHYRPRKDGFEARLWVMRRVDLGNYNKGILAGWGIDQRDPTTDRRLIEFGLSIPEEQFLVDGETKALTRRAFAGRLAPEVFHTRSKGYQAVDWHEGLMTARSAIVEEIGRLENCAPAATALDLSRLKSMTEDWPDSGWETNAVMRSYRLALLRGVAVGHFLRKAAGSNA